MTARKMSAILGSVRAFLKTTITFLMAFTDQLVKFVKQNQAEGWDKKLDIPLQLQSQVR